MTTKDATMDELEKIRELLPQQPPPSDRLVAEVRDQLMTAKPAPRLLAGLPRRPRLLVPIAVATAAAVAAAVVISLPDNENVPGARPPAPGIDSSTPHRQSDSARDILLVAADRAAQDAKETGRFWRTRTLTGYLVSGEPFGTPPNTYELEQRVIEETWLSGDGGEPDWLGHRDGGLHPTDKKAWEADGSPTDWQLDGIVPTAPKDGEVYQLPLENQVFPGATVQVGDLPTDPVRLRTVLLDQYRARHGEPGSERVAEEYLFECATQLLAEVPATPELRAAALRLLADLGGVQSSGPVKDPLGRQGNGITFTRAEEGLVVTTEVVIDTAAGTLLSVRYSLKDADGQVLKAKKGYYVAVLSAGWTDATPTVPSVEVP